jgi:TorA maturation chaperone TorD
MTLQAQTSVYNEDYSTDSKGAEIPDDSVIEQEQQYRASAYSLIAALLRAAPDQGMLERLSGLPQQAQSDGDDLMVAMSMLGLSAKMLRANAIEDEYQDLFIGLGKGEVVPYGSWYLTGFLMEKPLSDLRDDLIRLGYQRNDAVSEPEDHAAALCEVMSLMITENADLSVQTGFFQTHMANWMGRFFKDLSEARSAVFYKSLGRFGSAFVAFEHNYLTMPV